MLEKMGEFFDRRLDEYDEHQLTAIESAQEFYTYTAQNLPQRSKAIIIDLGCGTGLELEQYFKINSTAKVVGIDIAPKMLNALRKKLPDKDLTLILGSYFDIPFGNNIYDAAVSVESLHHFTKEEKIPLYKKVYDALKAKGYFILTDYFSMSVNDEMFHREELIRLKDLQGIDDNEFYHYDTPLTVRHEKEALQSAGFSDIKILKNWGHTYTLKSYK